MLMHVPFCQTVSEYILNERIYIAAIDPEMESLGGYMCTILEHWKPESPECVILKTRNAYGDLGEWGSYTEYIVMDYTDHIQKVIAAHRIQATWRAYRLRKLQEKSASIIQTWKNWLVKKNERWNPYTIGLTDLMLNFMRNKL